MFLHACIMNDTLLLHVDTNHNAGTCALYTWHTIRSASVATVGPLTRHISRMSSRQSISGSSWCRKHSTLLRPIQHGLVTYSFMGLISCPVQVNGKRTKQQRMDGPEVARMFIAFHSRAFLPVVNLHTRILRRVQKLWLLQYSGMEC